MTMAQNKRPPVRRPRRQWSEETYERIGLAFGALVSAMVVVGVVLLAFAAG